MRLLLILPITILMLFSMQARAADKNFYFIATPVSKSPAGKEEKKWYRGFEIGELKIRQSNDGTGIIKGVSCSGCDYQFVKITPDTEVFVNGVEAPLIRARDRAGQDAYIEFDMDTAEVKRIYWTESQL